MVALTSATPPNIYRECRNCSERVQLPSCARPGQPRADGRTRATSNRGSWYGTFHCLRRQSEGIRVRTEILKIHAATPETSLIKYAAEQIQAGQVLGMPTDTFYGLAADPFNLRAVERVYEIKSRLRHKPLSLLIENVDQAEEFARPFPDDFHLLARRFWPGPLTMIVPAASHLPLKVTATKGNVALRVPAAAIPLAVRAAPRNA